MSSAGNAPLPRRATTALGVRTRCRRAPYAAVAPLRVQRLLHDNGRAAATFGLLARSGDVGDRRADARGPQPRHRAARAQPAADGCGAGWRGTPLVHLRRAAHPAVRRARRKRPLPLRARGLPHRAAAVPARPFDALRHDRQLRRAGARDPDADQARRRGADGGAELLPRAQALPRLRLHPPTGAPAHGRRRHDRRGGARAEPRGARQGDGRHGQPSVHAEATLLHPDWQQPDGHHDARRRPRQARRALHAVLRGVP